MNSSGTPGLCHNATAGKDCSRRPVYTAVPMPLMVANQPTMRRYFMQVSDSQTTIFDRSIVPTTGISMNIGVSRM